MKLIQAARFLPVFSWLLEKIILIKMEYNMQLSLSP